VAFADPPQLVVFRPAASYLETQARLAAPFGPDH
jgi:hypothetical protein